MALSWSRKAAFALALSGIAPGHPAWSSPTVTGSSVFVDREALTPGSALKDPQRTIDAVEIALPLFTRSGPQASLYALRGLAYLKLKDEKHADADFAASRKADPANPDRGIFQFYGGLAAENMDEASRGLDDMLAVVPQRIRDLNPDFLQYYFVKYHGRRHDDQVISVAEGIFDSAVRPRFLTPAIKALLARKDLVRARALADQVTRIELLRKMLIDRAYEPVWPNLERVAGDHMRRAGEAELQAAKAAHEAYPDDDRAFNRLLNAYSDLRRYKEADRLAASFAATPAALAKLSTEGGQVVEQHAAILFQLGRYADADRRYAALIDANPDKPWLISMIIDREGLMIDASHLADAERYLPFVESNVAVTGSPYAKQIVRVYRVCIMAGLHKPWNASLMKDIVAHASDGPTMTLNAYYCAHRPAELKAQAIAMLRDPDERAAAIDGLQASDEHDPPSAGERAWASLRADRDVMAEFNKYGRQLPDRLTVDD